MKHALQKMGTLLNLLFVIAIIGALFYFLGVQPMLGTDTKESVFVSICFACGGLLMLAVHNSALRLFARRERAAQYFSLFCVGQSIRFFFMPDSVGEQLFPDLPQLFVQYGLRYIPFCVAVIALVLFVYDIYGEGRSKKLKYAAIVSVVVINILPAVGGDFTILRTILGLPIGILVNATCIYVLVKSPLLKKDRLSVLYLCGFILYIFSWVNSILSLNRGPLIAVAFNFLFAVIHAILLSSWFARMQEAERTLTAENAALDLKTRRMQELLQRVETTPNQYLTLGLLTLDIAASQAYVNGEDLTLTQKEFALLLLFAQNENKAMDTEQLYEKVWGQSMAGNDSAVKNMIYRLRKKLAGSSMDIQFRRNEGYVFARE